MDEKSDRNIEKYLLQNGQKWLLENHREKRGKYFSDEKYVSLLRPLQEIFQPKLKDMNSPMNPP